MTKAVAMTVHGRLRANSRGYPNELIEMIQRFGTWDGERQVLDGRDLRAFLDAIDAIRSLVIRLLDKGGGTAVFDEAGRLITIFNPRTYRPSRRSRRAFLAEA